MVDSVWFSKFFPERKYLSPIPCQRPFFNITIYVAYIWRREEKWHPKGYCISILSQKYPNHQHKSWERYKKTNTFLSLFVVSFIFSPCVKVTALTNSHQTPQMYSCQKQREKYQTDGRTGKNSSGHEGPWQKKLLFRQLWAMLSSECSTLSMFCLRKKRGKVFKICRRWNFPSIHFQTFSIPRQALLFNAFKERHCNIFRATQLLIVIPLESMTVRNQHI